MRGGIQVNWGLVGCGHRIAVAAAGGHGGAGLVTLLAGVGGDQLGSPHSLPHTHIVVPSLTARLALDPPHHVAVGLEALLRGTHVSIGVVDFLLGQGTLLPNGRWGGVGAVGGGGGSIEGPSPSPPTRLTPTRCE